EPLPVGAFVAYDGPPPFRASGKSGPAWNNGSIPAVFLVNRSLAGSEETKDLIRGGASPARPFLALRRGARAMVGVGQDGPGETEWRAKQRRRRQKKKKTPPRRKKARPILRCRCSISRMPASRR